MRLITLLLLTAVSVFAQFQNMTPAQIEAYRVWWWRNHGNRQQAVQQPVRQQPAVTQAPPQPATTTHPWHRVFPGAEVDEKGNVWHGDDTAKIQWISRSGFP